MALFPIDFSVLLEAEKEEETQSIKITADETEYEDDDLEMDESSDETTDEEPTEETDEGDEEATDYSDSEEEESPDDEEESMDSEETDSEEEDEESSDENTEVDDNKKNNILMDDFISLYYFTKTIITKVSSYDRGNILSNSVISQVVKNMTLLQEKLYKYIVEGYSTTYIHNLYQYNLYVQGIKINIEMLKKIKGFDVK